MNDYVYRRNRNPHKIYGYLRTQEMAELVGGFVQVRREGWLQQTRRFLQRCSGRGLAAGSRSRRPSRAGAGRRARISCRTRFPNPTPASTGPGPWRDLAGQRRGPGISSSSAAGRRAWAWPSKPPRAATGPCCWNGTISARAPPAAAPSWSTAGSATCSRAIVSLVLEALRERAILRHNAPHLVHDLPFIVPTYDWWEGPFYGVGLRLYDMLAGKHGFGPSVNLSPEETVATDPPDRNRRPARRRPVPRRPVRRRPPGDQPGADRRRRRRHGRQLRGRSRAHAGRRTSSRASSFATRCPARNSRCAPAA